MDIKRRFQLGVTLVEMIVFIVIVSVAISGILGVLNVTTGNSASPLERKQALAIAEALMQEIQQAAFTYCDPNDPNASVAKSYSDCAVTQQQSLTGPSPSTESRYNQNNAFDHVADYGNFVMPDTNCAGICRIGDATPISGLNGYSASVSLSAVGGGTMFPGVPSDAVLQVTVTVNGPANTRVVLKGYRVRYAPRV